MEVPNYHFLASMDELNVVSSSPTDHSLVYSEYFYQFIVSLAGNVIFYCRSEINTIL